ncbi:MAG: hypothetical protein ACYDC2_06380 [Solirubrobacteraceae bacterium]
MLAYVFWHRPAPEASQLRYEQALGAFHRSLARRRPAGMLGSAAYRVAGLPWPERREPAGGGMRVAPAFPLLPRLHAPAGYEDWYFVEDFAAIGVLNEAAVGRGHKTSHDESARLMGAGSAAIFALVEGDRAAMAAPGVSVWVARERGSARPEVAGLLADGVAGRSALWRRQLVLGPAPEFCLIAREPPPGVAESRLPAGWSARTLERELLLSE